MRFLVVLALVAGCGSHPTPGTPDLWSDHVDLSAPEPKDLSVVLPADLMPPTCTLPAPGFYYETMFYQYYVGTTPTPSAPSFNLIIENSGDIFRVSTPFSPTTLHCDPYVIDPTTCEAACCQGTPGVVPIIYFGRDGWELVQGGTCSFHDQSSGLSYTANITSLTGRLNF